MEAAVSPKRVVQPCFSSVKAYGRGSLLLRQGEPAHSVFYVESGYVKLVRSYSSGRQVIVGFCGSGAFIGAEAAVLSAPQPSTVVALGPCRMSRAESETFCEQVRTNPSLALQLLRAQSRYCYQQESLTAGFRILSAQDRLMLFLRWCSDGLAGRSALIPFSLRQREIAQFLAVTPQHLCSLLRKLEGEGLIHRNGRDVHLLDENAIPA